MAKVFIFLGGPDPVDPSDTMDLMDGDAIIAANSGLKRALSAGVVPTHIVGDLDSLPAGMGLDRLVVEKHPVDKDATDGDLALANALAMKPDRIIFMGATGGRLDHFLGNMGLLYRALGAGVRATMRTRGAVVYGLAPGIPVGLNLDDNSVFSVLPGPLGCRITLKGARWELDEESIPFGSTRCISNRTDKKKGYLAASVSEGLALLVHQIEGVN